MDLQRTNLGEAKVYLEGVDKFLEKIFWREMRAIAERMNERIGREGDNETLI